MRLLFFSYFSVANCGTFGCKKAWDGGCSNGSSLDIIRDYTRSFSIPECRKMCEQDTNCYGFSVGHSGKQRCVTYVNGCTPLTVTNAYFYTCGELELSYFLIYISIF